MKLYRTVAVVLAVSFVIVGLIFLLVPDGVLSFFNRLSKPLGMAPAPLTGYPFYLVLASGYMVLVALLAWLMFRHPRNRTFSSLLVQGKLATSLISLVFFLVQRPLLIYLANFVVDGLIALGVWLVSKSQGRESR
jgi:hypothetical protein